MVGNQTKYDQTDIIGHCGSVTFNGYTIMTKNNLSQSVLKRVLYGEVSLGGDAHHEEGLEGHEDVLEGVPHVGEEHDKQLVIQVQVEPL